MRALAILAVVLALPAAASAQTQVVAKFVSSVVQPCAEPEGNPPTLPAGFCNCKDTSCTSRARHLTDLIRRSDFEQVVRSAWAILPTVASLQEPSHQTLADVLAHINENYYRIVWKGVDADDKPNVYQLLLHDGKRAEPGNLLPGIHGPNGPQLYDVLVTDIVEEARSDGTPARESPLNTLSSVYASQQTDNKLLEQLPGFVAKTNVLQFWANATGPRGGRSLVAGEPRTEPVRHRTRYTVYHAELPDARATVQVTDQIVTSVPDVDAVIAKAAVTAAKFGRPAPLSSACAARVAQSYVESFRNVAPACRPPDAQTVANASSTSVELSETRETARDCADVLMRALRETTAAARKSKDCATSDGWNEEITAVEARFKGVVEAVGENWVTSTTRFVNEPRSRISFGVMAAATLGEPHVAGGYVRAELDARVFAADPLPHLLTAAVVNFHPWPYQASSPSLSWRERVRAFAGVTITPDFGIAAGVGCSLVRGLTVNVGGAVMWTNAVRADQVGKPVPEGVDKNRPFALKTVAAWLFGLSYSFK